MLAFKCVVKNIDFQCNEWTENASKNIHEPINIKYTKTTLQLHIFVTWYPRNTPRPPFGPSRTCRWAGPKPRDNGPRLRSVWSQTSVPSSRAAVQHCYSTPRPGRPGCSARSTTHNNDQYWRDHSGPSRATCLLFMYDNTTICSFGFWNLNVYILHMLVNSSQL